MSSGLLKVTLKFWQDFDSFSSKCNKLNARNKIHHEVMHITNNQRQFKEQNNRRRCWRHNFLKGKRRNKRVSLTYSESLRGDPSSPEQQRSSKRHHGTTSKTKILHLFTLKGIRVFLCFHLWRALLVSQE